MGNRYELAKCILGVLLLGTRCVHPCCAESPKAQLRNPVERVSPDHAISSNLVAVDAEAIAWQLVQAHLPELKTVLTQLREVQPRQYEVAIRQLSKAANRLESSRSRDPRLFEIELELLQAEQQVSLLIAKLKVRDHEPDRKKLRQAAARLQRSQVARAEYDVESLRHRIAKSQQQLDAALNRLEAKKQGENELLEKSYLNMLRKAGREAIDSRQNELDSQPPLEKQSVSGSTTPGGVLTSDENP